MHQKHFYSLYHLVHVSPLSKFNIYEFPQLKSPENTTITMPIETSC